MNREAADAYLNWLLVDAWLSIEQQAAWPPWYPPAEGQP